mmetsp:Transcript_17212/g.40005  ORF Transcript_17212/g.40005 Transcript_17212/m.40005 type:complete len:282 (-) Transcript_17212:2755-3600(-)
MRSMKHPLSPLASQSCPPNRSSTAGRLYAQYTRISASVVSSPVEHDAMAMKGGRSVDPTSARSSGSGRPAESGDEGGPRWDCPRSRSEGDDGTSPARCQTILVSASASLRPSRTNLGSCDLASPPAPASDAAAGVARVLCLFRFAPSRKLSVSSSSSAELRPTIPQACGKYCPPMVPNGSRSALLPSPPCGRTARTRSDSPWRIVSSPRRLWLYDVRSSTRSTGLGSPRSEFAGREDETAEPLAMPTDSAPTPSVARRGSPSMPRCSSPFIEPTMLPRSRL